MAGKNRVKKFIRRLSIAIFMGLLIMPSVAWGICRLTEQWDSLIMQALDYDLGENREPASFPKELNLPGITSELEAYYNDHVPFRSVIITLNSRINSRLERAYSSQIQPVLVALTTNKHTESNNGEDDGSSLDVAEQETSGQVQMSSEETSESLPVDEDETPGSDIEQGDKETDMDVETTTNVVEEQENMPNVSAENSDEAYLPPRELNGTVFGRDDWMFCNYDNSIEYYCGSNIMTEQQMKDKLSLMLKLEQICDAKGIQLQFMIAPNKEQVYSEYMPSYNVETDYKRVQHFVDYVKQNSEVGIIYPLAELKEAKNERSVYYKYDTHWNHYGSFIATLALYKDMGFELPEFEAIEYEEASCIWGLVITAGLSWQDYERDYDHVPLYKTEVQIIEADGEIDIIHTEKSAVYRAASTADKDCNFVMVGDSFRLYMAPYLERDFTNVCIAHRDNIRVIREDILAADILVIECVERLDDSLNGTLLELIKILGEEG